MTKRINIEETGSARPARARRNGAAGARNWRAKAKSKGLPQPRDVDSAVTEVVSFLLARGKRDGVNIGTPAPIDAVELALGAHYILERRGFDPLLASTAIKNRLHPRDGHLRPLFVPSLFPGDPELIPSPVGREGWSARIDQIVRFFQGPHAVTPTK